MTGIVSAPLANDITTALLIGASIGLLILIAIVITRGQKAERLANLKQYAPGDERIPPGDLTCDWCVPPQHGWYGKCTCTTPCDAPGCLGSTQPMEAR